MSNESILEVNNAAFVGHPENGAWTAEDLAERRRARGGGAQGRGRPSPYTGTAGEHEDQRQQRATHGHAEALQRRPVTNT